MGSALVTTARRTATTALVVALLPVTAALLLLAAVVGAPVLLVSGRPPRPVRIACFLLVYVTVEIAGLAAAAAQYLRDPFGGPRARQRRAERAYGLLASLLGVLRRAAERLFGLETEVTPALPAADRRPDVPLVVLVRHAGLGDSFLLLQLLLTEAGLLPHTVLKGALRVDPCLDVLLSRVPHCFLPPARGTAKGAVAALAAGLRAGDALVLFPEGGNFTPRRHHRAVALLYRRGQYRRAARAARLRYVLPPRDSGSLAALAAAPTADVLFVAHSGLDMITSARAAWTSLPLRQPVRVHWWRVGAADIPRGDEARGEWLMSQWERVDRWAAAHAAADTPHV
ncbi:1-acyl-sn-glycerol-3-phosphate acyltransferase [Streptomyces sp. HPF1205]|uniref:1-acyl-sn-glycerol-3-phosphate acyltransferase n=1 Tax=Streptomyces sp. HPF1205 TaxID=2873262 RepID=UPI001CEDB7DD|nr:1-acyl-sn-glycerol-3-phosphate acyltransferase [Streptomyces sp. HPF1205]